MLAGLELTVTPTLMSATPTLAKTEELVTYVVLSPRDMQVNNYVRSLLTQILLILCAHLNSYANSEWHTIHSGSLGPIDSINPRVDHFQYHTQGRRSGE